MTLINIIVPIFNQAMLTSQCVNSVLRSRVDQEYRLILIDDASTEREMASVLSSLAVDERVTILRNESNLGFTRTVNRGIETAGETDILILNSDTIVYDHWLDVMIEALHSAPNIATVNPMTGQNGSHISCYPFRTWSKRPHPEVVDRELAGVAAEFCRELTCDVHTCVGFCMLMSRKCIGEIGAFDATYFPRGYGEESDFCYRASALGWKHRIAGGAFVTHLHGKSFGDEKETLRSSMLPTFRSLHPAQPDLDRAFQESDPVGLLRRSLDLGRARRGLSGRSVIQARAVQPDMLQAGAPYLHVAREQTHTLTLRAAGSDLGFPSIEPYRIPGDAVRLISDLGGIGVTEIEFDRASDIIPICVNEFMSVYRGGEQAVSGTNAGLSWRPQRPFGC